MRQLNIMIKPASSLCNLRCRYCFYGDVAKNREVASYGFMSPYVVKGLVKNVFKDLSKGDSLNIAFQGGEPMLAGVSFYENFIEEVTRNSKAEQETKKSSHSSINVSYALQTNGILMDEAWCLFLKKHNFLVGLSLDCNKAIHDKNRIDSKGGGSFKDTIRAKQLLDKYKVEYNIMCVLTNELARHPQKVWKFMLEKDVKFIQFIPCLDELSGVSNNEWALSPRRFYEFYSTLAMLWQREVKRGSYRSVKLFDDIANLFNYGKVTSCGLNGQCHPQFIIESDGSIYPCDFYATDDYLIGNITETNFEEAFRKAIESGFTSARGTLPETCMECRYFKICCGGCRRLESHMYVDKSGFCGYRQFLDENLKALCR